MNPAINAAVFLSLVTCALGVLPISRRRSLALNITGLALVLSLIIGLVWLTVDYLHAGN